MLRSSWSLRLCSLLGLTLVGCIPGYVRVSVDASADLNQKQPVYMLVRTLDRKAYLAESYGEVAGKLVESDPSVLRKELLFPGKSASLYIKKPKGPLALYFLFTAPGGTWRLFVDAPLPLQVKAELKGSRLVQDSTLF
ncbi:MAG: hypothetical protein JNJ46_13160 [Myxococcales bacterium]|nr:hypothetical protein [Myxococcales bacterium]